jgi:hypothetical protein
MLLSGDWDNIMLVSLMSVKCRVGKIGFLAKIAKEIPAFSIRLCSPLFF